MIDPAGPIAGAIAGHIWSTFAVAGAVFLVVTVGLALALFRRRGQLGDAVPVPVARHGSVVVGVLGGVVPALILGAYLATSVATTAGVTSSREPDVVVDVTARQFWWEIAYPQYDVVTANELHIPAGKRVAVRLAAADVIHSFWVPQLAGKTDAVPGRTNTMWLEASQPGRYEGACAEYCGPQHAWMRILVIAEPQGDFDRWLAAQSQARAAPSGRAADGERVFSEKICASCHAVRGTSAVARIGPDLTHLASRSTLGAGVLPNDAGHLRDWISEPQRIKPGSLMPRVELSPAELDALLDYLGGLR